MENNIQIFNNPSFGEVRVAEVNGEPMFCLADVCKALDIKNVSDCKSRLKQDGVVTTDTIDSMGRTQQAIFVNESNLYKCIFQSRRPDAEKFQDWVFEDVLPSIRKHGAYLSNEAIAKAQPRYQPENLIPLGVRVCQENKRIGYEYIESCDII